MKGAPQTAFVVLSCALVVACGSYDYPTSNAPAAPSVQKVVIIQDAAQMAVGASEQYTVKAFYSDSDFFDVTTAAVWTSSDNSVASITATGLVNAGAMGATNIGASYGGKSTSVVQKIVQPLAVDFSQFQNCASASCSSAWVSQFHVANWYWSDGTIFGEPVLPLATRDGSAPRFTLWAPVSKILKVEQAKSQQVYSEGSDYLVSGNQLVIPAGSTIHLAPADFPNTLPPPPDQFHSFEVTKEGGPLRISNDYLDQQLSITYQPAALPAAPIRAKPLPRFQAKLKNCSPIAISYYGDSVTAGANSSYTVNDAPFQRPFVDLVGAYLSQLCPGQVFYRDQGVVGDDSANGLALVRSQASSTASDVVFLGYGLNDAGLTPVSKADFKAHLQSMIKLVRYNAPGTEFVLLSGILANPDWKFTDIPSFSAYRDAMNELAQQDSGITVIDVTTPWASLISQKSYYDLTANGSNHPGDFGHLLYAQIIINSLVNAQ